MLRRGVFLLVTMIFGYALVLTTPVRAQTATELRAEQIATRDTTSYALPPDKLMQAKALTRERMLMLVVGTLWSFGQLLLLLRLGARRMRDLSVRMTRARALQTAVFVFLLVLVLAILDLPLTLYAHHIGLAYGLSVQSWTSWLGDQAKTLALTWIIGSLAAMMLFGTIRRSPTRWWLRFSVGSIVFVIAGLFVTPYVIDPLFNHFSSMQQNDPALVASLQRVVARGGLAIPPERMYIMQASAKYTGMNAYVTGFGASKRIVVWDTTIAKAAPDEIAFIFGHEMGHYALGHIVLGTAITCLALPVAFWLIYLASNRLLRRYGTAWGIPSNDGRPDLLNHAVLVVFLLVGQAILLVQGPAANAISRHFEHAADVYGQEAVHGIVANPQAASQHAFQALGELSLDDPTPHPWMEWWSDTHPPIRTRAAFAKVYDPWAQGEEPRYFRR